MKDEELREPHLAHLRTGPVRRSKKGGWTEEEDEILKKAVKDYKGKSWKKIAERLPGRSNVQCLHRWQKVLNPNLLKGPWQEEEDQRLIELVRKYGPENWSLISKEMKGRIGKQCRERWFNHLDPAIKKTPWTDEEIEILMTQQERLGNKWAEISKFLQGRPNNQCKNQYNSIMNKRSKKLKSEKKKKPSSLKIPTHPSIHPSPLMDPSLRPSTKSVYEWNTTNAIQQNGNELDMSIQPQTLSDQILVDNFSSLIAIKEDKPSSEEVPEELYRIPTQEDIAKMTPEEFAVFATPQLFATPTFTPQEAITTFTPDKPKLISQNSLQHIIDKLKEDMARAGGNPMQLQQDVLQKNQQQLQILLQQQLQNFMQSTNSQGLQGQPQTNLQQPSTMTSLQQQKSTKGGNTDRMIKTQLSNSDVSYSLMSEDTPTETNPLFDTPPTRSSQSTQPFFQQNTQFSRNPIQQSQIQSRSQLQAQLQPSQLQQSQQTRKHRNDDLSDINSNLIELNLDGEAGSLIPPFDGNIVDELDPLADADDDYQIFT